MQLIMQTQKGSASSFLFLLIFIFLPSPAHAYIGPGLGLGTIGVVIGVLASSVLILISILWYPLKRFFKWLRRAKKQEIQNP
jgi:hypothetical protein